MRSILLALSLSLGLVSSVFATEPPVKIRVKLANYPKDTLMLGYHYGDKQYLKDTAAIGADGWFTFDADTEMECGVYLVIMKPDNQYFQILVREGEQNFSIQTDAKDAYKDASVKGSPDNLMFFNYMKYLSDKRAETEPWTKILRDSTKTDTEKAAARAKLEIVDKDVKAQQAKIVSENSTTLTAIIIKTAQVQDIPEENTFPGPSVDEQKKQRYQWYRSHYFDNFPLDNPCLVRTPLLQVKIDTFLERVVPQHPDSINSDLDKMLNLMNVGGTYTNDNYKYYLSHLLTRYAKSQYVGMDAVYVHLAKNYYCAGKAPNVEAEQLKKICDDANRLEPILVGKTAPNVRLFQRDSTKTLALYDVKAKYTILMVWDPECGHCKKTMPDVEAFYAKWKSKGVEIFAICNRRSELDKCWSFIDEHEGRMNWINLVDPKLLSRYSSLYDVKTTPKVYILDEQKKIVMKGVGGEQLDGIMDQLIEQENTRLKESLKNK